MRHRSPPVSRSRPEILRRYLPGALLVVALLAAFGMGFGGIPVNPETALILLILGTLTVQYRPWGTFGLGVGAVVLPSTVLVLGASALPWMVLAISTAAALSPRLRGTLRHRRLDDVTRHVLVATIVAGVDKALTDPSIGWRLAVGATLWISGLALVTWLQHWVAGRSQIQIAPLSASLLVESSSLSVGAVLAVVTLRLGLPAATLLGLAMALLILESHRQARLRHQAEVKVRALQRLSRAGRRLVTSPSQVENVAEPLYRECRQVLRFDGFELTLHPRRDGEPNQVWSAGTDGVLHEAPLDFPPYPPSRPGIHKRLEWTQFEHSLTAGGEQALANLRLWCDPRSLSPDSEALLTQLVPQLGGMVYRAVLGEQARQDPLTGAALRRVLDTRLESSFRRRHEEGGRVAVILCDLDFFKRINDTFGHAAGDRALKAVARVLTEGLREVDLCARYGGEEFALILEDLTGDQVLEVADHLRRSIEALAVPVESPGEDGASAAGDSLPLSMSAGIAVYPEVHCQQADELLEMADTALYEAKRLGRNCCLIYRGGGRYQDARGRIIETAEPSSGLSAPQIFA